MLRLMPQLIFILGQLFTFLIKVSTTPDCQFFNTNQLRLFCPCHPSFNNSTPASLSLRSFNEEEICNSEIDFSCCSSSHFPLLSDEIQPVHNETDPQPSLPPTEAPTEFPPDTTHTPIQPPELIEDEDAPAFVIPPPKSKLRPNYASIDCAASILASNPGAKLASHILLDSKDKYMLNVCDADKFVVVELCEEILIDTVVLANYEFFSSTFKDFKVYVAKSYPVTKGSDWLLLGSFRSNNSRDPQEFHISNPIIWTKYLKVEILTHYGGEYYCPLSLLRVHGINMMEEYKLAEEERLKKLSNQSLSATLPGKVQPVPSPSTNETLVNEDDYFCLDYCPDTLWDLGETPCSTKFSRLRFIMYKSQNAPVLNSNGTNVTNNVVPEDRPPLEVTTNVENLPTNVIDIPVLPTIPTDPIVIPAPEKPLPNLPVNTGPTMQQESVFKSIMKRLEDLEENARVASEYLEEQTANINKAFLELEQSQSDKMSHVIHKLNRTTVVYHEQLRQAYNSSLQLLLANFQRYRNVVDFEFNQLKEQIYLVNDEVRLHRYILFLESVIIVGLLWRLYYMEKKKLTPSADDTNSQISVNTVEKVVAYLEENEDAKTEDSVETETLQTLTPESLTPTNSPTTMHFATSEIKRKNKRRKRPNRR